MTRTSACLMALTACCALGQPTWAEEALCPKNYDANEGWLGAFQCEKGDIMTVRFNKEDEADAPRVAAAFCELEDITLFRGDEMTALICRYRGGQRWPREALGQCPQ